jgi:hypothetical protein
MFHLRAPLVRWDFFVAIHIILVGGRFLEKIKKRLELPEIILTSYKKRPGPCHEVFTFSEDMGNDYKPLPVLSNDWMDEATLGLCKGFAEYPLLIP